MKRKFEWPTTSDGSLDLEEIERLACAAKPFKDEDGIEGRLKSSGKYPYKKLYFVPTTKGKRHPKYLEIKHYLHDDWSTDVSDTAPESISDYLSRALRARMP